VSERISFGFHEYSLWSGKYGENRPKAEEQPRPMMIEDSKYINTKVVRYKKGFSLDLEFESLTEKTSEFNVVQRSSESLQPLKYLSK
jgi:hypothetical protein